MRSVAFVLLLSNALVFSTILAGCSNATATKSATSVAVGTVTIVIDDGKETVEHKIENVTAGTTVEQLMRELDGETTKISGSGSTAILTSLRGLTNAGTQGWTYRVDEDWADRSMGAYELTPPATVLWKYGDFAEMNE